MAIVNLNLSYPQLSALLQQEINKKEIVVKGYEISVQQLSINADKGKIKITGMIASKWDASFDFSAVPLFRSAENKIELEDLQLDLDANNFIFKGILMLAKGNVKSRIEKLIENPIDLALLKVMIDKELRKAPLPYKLGLCSTTKSITINSMEVQAEHLSISAAIDLELDVSFKDIPESIA